MNKSPTSPPPLSPSGNGTTTPPPFTEAPKEGLISRLLITPLTFMSFIISLFLVSTHNHSLRTNTPPPTTLYGRTKAFLHAAVFTPTSASAPYAYVQNPLEKEKVGLVGTDGFVTKRTSSASGDSKEKLGEDGWHWHSQQKRMMKAEMADAFRIRSWVVAVLLVGGGGMLLLGLMLLRWVWGFGGVLLMSSGAKLGGDW